MQLAKMPHDCTTQLVLRLAHCLSSDAFDPNPVGAEATHRCVLEVELSAAKVSPITQIQKHFSHQKFSSLRLSWVQAHYCQCFP